MKYVYFNLHKNVFSVKDVKTGRVAGDHRDLVMLVNATFKVSKAGRERVLRERVKNVHAGVRGRIYDNVSPTVDTSKMVQITYNPYKYDSFVTLKEKQPIMGADLVVMKTVETDNGKKPTMFALNPKYFTHQK